MTCFVHFYLFALEMSHPIVVFIGSLMSTRGLSPPPVMTTEHPSLQGFGHRITGSIHDSLMRKCFVLSYAQQHWFKGDYLWLTLFLGHLRHALTECHHHAINLDVKEKDMTVRLNGILTMSFSIFCDDGIYCFCTKGPLVLKSCDKSQKENSILRRFMITGTNSGTNTVQLLALMEATSVSL